jgi:hypothetical protein
VKAFHLETDQIGIYDVKPTRKSATFEYLRAHPALVERFKELTFVRRYDEAAYLQLIILAERFFKVYTKMMTEGDRERCRMNYDIIVDIRLEILAVYHQIINNIPELARAIEDKGNLRDYVHERRSFHDNIMKRKMRIVRSRCMLSNDAIPGANHWGGDRRFYVYA